MPVVKIQAGGRVFALEFEGALPLQEALKRVGAPFQRPCGGRGVCGKCAVSLRGSASAPSESERRFKTRLACQAVLTGDCEITVPDAGDMIIETGGTALNACARAAGEGCGAALDIGTTTLALRLYDLKTGKVAGEAAMLNPQTSVSADVMGRIGAAMNGSLTALTAQVRGAAETLIARARAQAGSGAKAVTRMVATGNTTMLYLLTGRDPTRLSRAPFEADCLFDTETELCGTTAYLPPCVSAFVGADIVCAVLASGLCEKKETALIIDIGTNGEMALWKDGTLYTASTAAGPAFEGAGISCGMGSAPGAIDRVWLENGVLRAHTIGEIRPAGLCGSGLLDAVAALLRLGVIEDTGAMEESAYALSGNVTLSRADIRSVQLAKAAIAAGIQTLLESADVKETDIERLYIAGGFGSHINLESAADIGLIPALLTPRATCLGNAALTGAAQILLSADAKNAARAIVQSARGLSLGGNPRFADWFMEKMTLERA